jgi:hypothetical protein
MVRWPTVLAKNVAVSILKIALCQKPMAKMNVLFNNDYFIIKYVALIIFGARLEGVGTRASVPQLNPPLG